MKDFKALNEARVKGRSFDFSNEDEPKCPHCGEVYDIAEHEHYELYDTDEGSHEAECTFCEKVFSVIVGCKFSYSTDEADEDLD